MNQSSISYHVLPVKIHATLWIYPKLIHPSYKHFKIFFSIRWFFPIFDLYFCVWNWNLKGVIWAYLFFSTIFIFLTFADDTKLIIKSLTDFKNFNRLLVWIAELWAILPGIRHFLENIFLYFFIWRKLNSYILSEKAIIIYLLFQLYVPLSKLFRKIRGPTK